ncbi:alpha/beta hydrolase, partial [bacterium]|nr:alpha/beta hydrolase [bacterium]
RVLRYDLFGRGFSDRPELKYEPEVFVQQLHELMSALKLDKKVTLVGWSMGGAISMYYARKYPDKVSKLVLTASAGFPPKLPMALKLLTLPGLGRWLMSKVGEKSTFAALKGHFSNHDLFPEYYENSKVQMRYKGFKRTLLSTLVNFPFNDLPPLVAEVGRHPRPVLLIWGKKDEITPYEAAAKFKEFIPNLELLDFENAKHAVHYEHFQEVNEKMIAFLNG